MSDDRRPGRVLTQHEIEEQIHAICDELESEVERYADLSDAAAEAEADYKMQYARALVGIADETRGDRQVTSAEREARAVAATGSTLRAFKITEARRQVSRESLLSMRARLDALRTLSANVRAQT